MPPVTQAVRKKKILFAGRKLIIEIGKRGLRGYFFTYEQYQELKKIRDFDDLKRKIVQYGHPSVKEANNSREIVDKLHIKMNKKATAWISLEMAFWFIISLATCS